MDFITIDFETATSERCSPCEVGLTFVKNGLITETKSWFIKPYCYPYFDDFNTYIHGIKAKDVSEAPQFDVLWKELLPLIENQCLIAHNAAFDFSVLRNTLDLYNIPYPQLNYTCSYIFSKKVWSGLPSYNLKSLCYHNKIQLKHHRAASDSRATAELALLAFKFSDISCLDDFPEKLKTVVGQLFPGGYYPSTTKREYKSIGLALITGNKENHKSDNLFYGRKVVFTGTLSSMKRADAHKAIVEIGGLISDKVSGETDYLIVGQQDYRVVGEDGLSSKQEKAIKLVERGAALEIISESDFLNNL